MLHYSFNIVRHHSLILKVPNTLKYCTLFMYIISLLFFFSYQVPQDPSVLRTNVYYCRSCCQYLPSTDFELSTKSRYIGHCLYFLLSPSILPFLLSLHSPYSVIGHCRQCKELDNKACAKEDYTLYHAMLKTIRKTEENYQVIPTLSLLYK